MIIERCANGWIIRPRHTPGDAILIDQVYVFRAWDEAQRKLYELLGGDPGEAKT